MRTRRLALLGLFLAHGVVQAQVGDSSKESASTQGPNGVFLVAKPDLTDPNFSRTVVLVTQTEDFSTVGVIINRPSTLKLAQFMADPGVETGKYRDTVYMGGPVMRNALVAVFQSTAKPAAPAFHVLRDLYLTIHPDNMTMLLGSSDRRYRLYAGFSGWAPRQLQSEFEREGWYVLPAEEEILFRNDTTGIWEELVERVRALKTRAPEDDRRMLRKIEAKNVTQPPVALHTGLPG